ncbi:MAG: phosphopantetheine-binding protein [Terrimicrobiaceae bacterium]|nr:phosphopantetheine-binding protein [Terrimicrobiaceae bacterium]
MRDADRTREFVREGVAKALVSITGVEELRDAGDLKIRELGLLDSLGIVSLILALSEQFEIDIAPGEIEEEDVATPRAIAEFVRKKLGQGTH